MDITNNSGATITVDRFFAYWLKTPQSQKLDRLFLDLDVLWNTSDSAPPSDIPTESPWRGGTNRTIPDTMTRTLVLRFQNNLQSTGYQVHVVFNVGCQVIRKK